ncbi:MAG TPA: glycosyltransferase family 2 protein [Gemmatimonadaceae bacterium]|nr:glycosyltransferase family 2 protein [Gemmatimonadaceae bacterium]
MLYLCIPVHNEAPTVGLLLWRIRKVFQQYSREYEIILYNDGSTDSTGDTITGYGDVLPLTVLGSEKPVGYGRALEACCREANSRSRYPRRDALIVMQGDFTDAPEHVPELVRRFEGGADVVTAERAHVAGMPAAVRRLRLIGRWLLRSRRTSLGTSDPLSGFRLYRIGVIRELLRSTGEGPLLKSHGTAADVELLLAAATVARRLESVSTNPRYDLRQRGSRLRAATQAVALFRIARAAPRATVAAR